MLLKKLLLLLIATFLAFWYFLPQYNGVTKIVEEGDTNELPIKFYHKFYIDQRYSPWRIRLFAMKPCGNHTIFGKAFYGFAKKAKTLQFLARQTEKWCPYEWDMACFYNSFFYEAETSSEIPEYLELYIGNSRRVVQFTKSKIVGKSKKKGLTVIVAPLYFYSHPHNILLFFEILPWSGFGELPKYIQNRYPEPDSSVCRNGQTLAQNIAVLETDTDLATSVDFDEILVSENNLSADSRVRLEFAANPELAAAVFRHFFAVFQPKIENFEYSGVLTPMVLDRKKADKFIFNASRVDNIDVHHVNTFIEDKFKAEILKNAALLHYRHNGFQDNSTQIKLDVKIFANLSAFVNLQNLVSKIFGRPPKLRPKLNEDLDECFGKLEKIEECRSLVYFCKPAVMKWGEAWDFEKTPANQIFL
ncbi:unnamed protein product [Caenorhabditis angaria]|uniref:Glycosyltransferase family 92 protein n=1 Tax=Caenorhabditis angaria TaxID=860376 RepID=A0A9P1IQQ9_9PELO|nr:unnamed protein product [Caenorhabditis angaria]